jgi:hypothetical protein
MKIRSLLLGSVAAAGLSTGAFAADLGVLTSLDVCDALGLSGLTISSDTNCLQITGEVRYRFQWGDYDTEFLTVETALGGENPVFAPNDTDPDWRTRVNAWIKFVATADSDFGPAKAVIKIADDENKQVTDAAAGATGSGEASAYFDEAYVSIGDTTVFMAGKKGSIANLGDDLPLNWLGLFGAAAATNDGVQWVGEEGTFPSTDTETHVLQVVHDLGNGLSIGAGLENLESSDIEEAGTAVGVITYAGDGISAHATFLAGGVLDGTVEDWAVHAGFAGTFDMFKFVAAVAADNTGFWDVLASASATFDMFTIAASGEAFSNGDYGVGGSLSAAVADGITLNLGGRYYREDAAADDNYQIAASVVAAVTETLTFTGEVGYLNDDDGFDEAFYGSAALAWAPGGNFTASGKATVTSEQSFRLETDIKKTFQ